MRSLLPFACCCAVAVSSLASAKKAAEPSTPVPQTCTAVVTVNAFDAATKADLHGLRAGDFEAHRGRTAYSVKQAIPVLHNRVLVLVDVRGATTNEGARAIAAMVREQAPPDMPVAFGLIADQAVFTQGFFSDYDAFGAEIERVFSHHASGTRAIRIGAALGQGLLLFGSAQPGDTILLVTPGKETAHLRVDQLAREFNRHQVRLQLLMPPAAPSGNDPSSLFSSWNAADHFSVELLKLAAKTGGALMGFMNTEWVEAASSGYVLAIDLPQSRDQGDLLKVNLREVAGNADLFYPEAVALCSASYSASASSAAIPQP